MEELTGVSLTEHLTFGQININAKVGPDRIQQRKSTKDSRFLPF